MVHTFSVDELDGGLISYPFSIMESLFTCPDGVFCSLCVRVHNPSTSAIGVMNSASTVGARVFEGFDTRIVALCAFGSGMKSPTLPSQ